MKIFSKFNSQGRCFEKLAHLMATIKKNLQRGPTIASLNSRKQSMNCWLSIDVSREVRRPAKRDGTTELLRSWASELSRNSEVLRKLGG